MTAVVVKTSKTAIVAMTNNAVKEDSSIIMPPNNGPMARPADAYDWINPW